MQTNLSHHFTVVLIHHLQALNLPQSPVRHRQIQFLLPRVFVSAEIFKDVRRPTFVYTQVITLSTKSEKNSSKIVVLAKALLLTYDNVCPHAPFHRLASPAPSLHPPVSLSLSISIVFPLWFHRLDEILKEGYMDSWMYVLMISILGTQFIFSPVQ